MRGTTLADLVKAKRRHLAEAASGPRSERELNLRTALHLRRIIRAWSREWNE